MKLVLSRSSWFCVNDCFLQAFFFSFAFLRLCFGANPYRLSNLILYYFYFLFT